MSYSHEQDTYLIAHRYPECAANTTLFPTLSHRQYVRRRAQLRADGVPVPDLRGRPRTPSVDVTADHLVRTPEAVWNAVVTFQQATVEEKADLEISVDTDRPHGIVFLSDWHIGNRGTDHQRILADIQLINSCELLSAYVGGDGVDNFIPDKLNRVARDEQVANPEQQWAMYRYLIEQLKPSLLAVGGGNHDGWTQAMAGINGVEAALRGIPVVHTGEDAYINLTVGDQTYTVLRKHRPPSSSRMHRAAGVKLLYEVGQRTFDLGVSEHLHVGSLTCEPRHGLMRYFVTTGSYKVRDSHAAEFGFTDGGICTPVVVFHPGERRIVPFLSIEDSIRYLEN